MKVIFAIFKQEEFKEDQPIVGKKKKKKNLDKDFTFKKQIKENGEIFCLFNPYEIDKDDVTVNRFLIRCAKSFVFSFVSSFQNKEIAVIRDDSMGKDFFDRLITKIAFYLGISCSEKKIKFEGKADVCQQKVNIYKSYLDLVETTANKLGPDKFRERIKQIIKESGLEEGVDFSIKEIIATKESGFGGLHAVGKGSEEQPALVVIHFGKDCEKTDRCCVIGKGVTYDTGGLSIKDTDNMLDMHKDMSGAALMFSSALLFYTTTKKPITCLLPIAENSVDGKSYRPGDIIDTYSGKTIQVMNTDAEGRIILADAVAYQAKELSGITSVLVAATLTGALRVCLGREYAAYITHSDSVSDLVEQSRDETGEYLSRLPNDDIFLKPMLDADEADIRNTTGGYGGGTITAHKFVEFFHDYSKVKNYVHFDVANYYERELEEGNSADNLLSFMVCLLSKLSL